MGSYSPTGHLLFARGTTLLAQRFDAKSLRLTGSAATVATGIEMNPANGEAKYAVDANGDLLYVPGGLLADARQLLLVSRDGTETPVVPTRRPYSLPVMSRDGSMVAVCLESYTYDIWLLDVARDIITRVSFGADDTEPIFAPDGRYVFWRSARSGVYNIYGAPTDGSGGEERLTNSPRMQYMGCASPDGRYLAFSEESEPGSADVMLLEIATRQVRRFVGTEHDERVAGFSPDGRWIMYWSTESGRRELYVRPFPGAGGRWQVTSGAGESSAAEWSADGRTIIYRNGPQFYLVPVETTPSFRAGKPQLLFTREYERDVQFGPDGRLLLVKPAEIRTVPQLSIALNWTSELTRRVPR
jgi:serine/threonine-protein kinase